MHRILFVDDEPKILTGLRRMLRSMRHTWEMEFAEGGVHALELLAARRFDAIVTDARMPGMEGGELLERVRSEYPDTVRMILSGQCSRDSVLRCVGVAHQFLSKPCDADTLKGAIRGVCRLRNSFLDPQAQAATTAVDSLPSVPAAFGEFVQQIERETPLRVVGNTIASDIAMSAKVLQLVSSGFFGSPQATTEVERAVELLGTETLRALASGTNAFRPSTLGDESNVLLEEFTRHCRSVAIAARSIAESVTTDPEVHVQSQVAGMLHEVGSLVQVPASTQGSTLDLDAGLALPDETCSAEKGGYLASLWGLPTPIVEAIGHHHSPSVPEGEGFSALTAVHVADAYVETSRSVHGNAAEFVDHPYLARIGCAERLDEWREICQVTCSSEVLQ